MLAYLKGQIIYKSALPKKDNFLVVATGGVGYKVFALDKSINEKKIGDEIELHLYTQVAETVLDLYGFAVREELDFFELLISISGVGPRSALGILQKAKVEDLKSAVQSGSADILNKVSGIGPKTAQKIVDGLKDKLGSWSGAAAGWAGDFSDALEALVGLGYSSSQASEALKRCESRETGEKIKEALKILGGK